VENQTKLNEMEVKMKKKTLKLQIGEAYNKTTKENYPIYATFWENEDGSYSRTQKVFVNEVEIKDKEKKELVEA